MPQRQAGRLAVNVSDGKGKVKLFDAVSMAGRLPYHHTKSSRPSGVRYAFTRVRLQISAETESYPYVH